MLNLMDPCLHPAALLRDLNWKRPTSYEAEAGFCFKNNSSSEGISTKKRADSNNPPCVFPLRVADAPVSAANALV